MSSVQITALKRAYGDQLVVNGFEASIASGEFISFLGPSGCGKTTTLRMIAGLDQPTAGEIRIGDRVVSAPAAGVFVPPEQRQLGMVFQSYALWPHMTVGENVAYPLTLRGTPRDEREKQALRMLDLVHLAELAGRHPHQLSGGQQQRVALARALVVQPQVLLLDEPLSNLDAQLREELRFEVKDLQRRLGVTVVFVTHDQAEAMAMSDRIMVMLDGRIRQAGPPRELYDRPIDPFVCGFLGAANFAPGKSFGPGGGRCRVRLDGVTGSALIDCRGELEPGAAATVAVRPEAIRIRPAGQGRIAAQVRRVTFLGDRIDCRVALGPLEWRLSAPAAQAPEEGSEIGLDVSEASAFPAA